MSLWIWWKAVWYSSYTMYMCIYITLCTIQVSLIEFVETTQIHVLVPKLKKSDTHTISEVKIGASLHLACWQARVIGFKWKESSNYTLVMQISRTLQHHSWSSHSTKICILLELALNSEFNKKKIDFYINLIFSGKYTVADIHYFHV